MGPPRTKWGRRGYNAADLLSGAAVAIVRNGFSVGVYCANSILREVSFDVSSTISTIWNRRETSSMQNEGRVAVVQNEPIFKPVDKRIIQRVTFRDVVGLNTPKQEVMARVITPLLHQDKARVLKIVEGGGLLLVGPPGNGKSMLAKAVANEINMAVFEITTADIIKRSQENSVKRVRELFRIARSFERVVIIINEIEGIIRESNSPINQAVDTQFMNETDGFLNANEKNKMVMLFGTSNKPEVMRAAAKRTGRFDEVIFVGVPYIHARKRILEKAMSGVPASDDINYEYLASQTRLFSCSDLSKGLVQKAKRVTLLRSTGLCKNEVNPVCMQDFLTALKESRPSVSRKDLFKWYPAGLESIT